MAVSRLFLALLILAASFAACASSLEFGDLEARLHLDRAQKAQFDRAVGATRSAMLASGLVALEIKARLADELGKSRPDLGRLLGDPDAIAERVEPLWRDAHAEWSRFYALLDARQVAIAREYIERRLAMLESLGGSLLQGLQQNPKP